MAPGRVVPGPSSDFPFFHHVDVLHSSSVVLYFHFSTIKLWNEGYARLESECGPKTLSVEVRVALKQPVWVLSGFGP